MLMHLVSENLEYGYVLKNPDLGNPAFNSLRPANEYLVTGGSPFNAIYESYPLSVWDFALSDPSGFPLVFFGIDKPRMYSHFSMSISSCPLAFDQYIGVCSLKNIPIFNRFPILGSDDFDGVDNRTFLYDNFFAIFDVGYLKYPTSLSPFINGVNKQDDKQIENYLKDYNA